MNKNIKNITGKKFNKLTAIKFSHIKNRNAYWVCKCDCGNKAIVKTAYLINGNTKSCGCLKYKWKKHNMSKTRFYNIWYAIKSRTCNKNSISYKNYGGRNIKCEWKNFEEFKNDMYESYTKHSKKYGDRKTSIDRIDNSGNYSKKNCQWVTMSEQASNKRCNNLITYKGITKPLMYWVKKYNIPYETARYRILKCLDLDKVFSKKYNSKRNKLGRFISM